MEMGVERWEGFPASLFISMKFPSRFEAGFDMGGLETGG